ncbi:MAG: beta-ketoacyl-ACP synthase III [Myxococcota bacterium]
MNHPPRAHIYATGSYIPPRQVSNDDLAKQVETSDAWIQQRTGIKTRFLIDPSQGICGTVDMAQRAAQAALSSSNTDPQSLDMIIVGTVTSDQRMPSAACLLQERIGATRASAFDVSAACCGSLYALAIANSFITQGACKRILVVGSETMSCLLDWSDRSTCVLFGDGAACAILEPSSSPDRGFHHIKLYSDGSLHPLLHVKRGEKLHMSGQALYRAGVPTLVSAAEALLQEAGLQPQDIACVIPHQANIRILESIAKRLNIPMQRFAVNLDRYANTSSASLLLAWDQTCHENRLQSGDWVLFWAIGAGLTWATGLYRV